MKREGGQKTDDGGRRTEGREQEAEGRGAGGDLKREK